MLSLAWLTVFIIFVYVPGSTLNVIERSSSLVLLSKSDSEVAASKLNKSSVEGSSSSSSPSLSLSLLSSLMPGDADYAKEKLIFKTNNNKTEEGEIIELSDIPATIAKNTTTTLGKYQQQQRVESFKQEQVSDNAHSLVTKDPSPSLLLLTTSPSSSSSSLLNIELTHPTTSTTETPTTTTTTSTAIRTTRTTTTKPKTATTAKNTTTTTPTTTTARKAIRTWNNLNDFGNDKNYNGQRSCYGQHETTPQPPPLPPPAAQQQNRQHLQLALLSEGSGRAQQQYSSSSSSGSRNTTTILPSQLTQSIQNTASVIIRGNSLNWGYVELAPSDSPPFLITSSASSLSLSSTPRTDVQTATRQPKSQPSSSSSSSTSSAASFGLSLSPGSSSFLYSSELPLMSFTPSAPAPASSWPTTAASPLSPTTVSSLLLSSSSLSSSMSALSTTSTTTARTTTSTTTRKPASDGYLNITSQAGTHAYLPCNVKQLVKKPISWLRVRDGHILTVDQTTFIADQRFQSIYTPNPERWSLQIKYVQTKDAGTYECQVSTEPKTSAIVSLNIVEPKTELIGESNRHVKAGSQVKLRCIISQALEPPLYINWYHNRQQIFLHNRKGWRTEIERDPTAGMATTAASIGSSSSSSNTNRDNSNDKQSTTIASLIIPSVSKKDSGNYTCSPSNSAPITVVLHVLNGEYSASAITSGSARSNSIKDIQGLLHLIPWVISFVMWYFGQMLSTSFLALQPPSEQDNSLRRTSLMTAAVAVERN